jgi:plasmid stabilization system protein ParE
MRVQYLARARDDIAAIYEYRIKHHSVATAGHIEVAIRASIEMLAANPEFGRTTDHRRAVRRWPMSEYPYTIYYQIDGEISTITIVRVIASGRVRNLQRVPRG